jgi:dolichyl-phosphate-mannose--protein O-mannosyl transferase
MRNQPTHRSGTQSIERLKTPLCYLLIFTVAYCCFMVNRSDPPNLFWDENYHVTSAERYLEGIAHFEPHPPLGLMLIAVGEAWSETNTTIDKQVLTKTKQISGDAMPKGFDFGGMRLMPSLFAVLGALAFYGLMFALFAHRLHALLLTGLYLFENVFTVHFRAVHLDSFQLFFCIAFLWHFIVLWQRTSPVPVWQYATLAALAGLAIMVKINAVILLILFPVLYFKDARSHAHQTVATRITDFFSKSGAAIASVLLVSFVVFYVHALLTPAMPDIASSAGKQDIENMSPIYRRHLEQQTPLTPGVVFAIARDYYKFMDKDHQGVPKLDTTKPGENGSHPLHWPFHDRNINYRWDSADGKTAYVQLVGNQLMWYSGTAAAIFSLILIINYRLFAIPLRGSLRTYHLVEVFAGLYLAFMLLHLWLITQRVMYLYHYFMGLTISYVLLALMWQYLSEVHEKFARHRTTILACAMAAYLGSYLFFLPLSNHTPMTKEQCERRNISISHIVDCR